MMSLVCCFNDSNDQQRTFLLNKSHKHMKAGPFKLIFQNIRKEKNTIRTKKLNSVYICKTFL